MLTNLADFGRQRTFGSALGFALFWTVIADVLFLAVNFTESSILFHLMNGRASPAVVAVLPLLTLIGPTVVPLSVGLSTVYHKWNDPVVLILLASLVACAVFVYSSLLTFPVYALLAMRPSTRPVSSGRARALFVAISVTAFGLAMIIIYWIGGRHTIRDVGSVQSITNNPDTQRQADVYMILLKVHDYANRNRGAIYQKIPDTDIEICRPHATDCKGLLDLPSLINDPLLPVDPAAQGNGTGYMIHKNKVSNAGNKEYGPIYGFTLRISAPLSRGKVISVTDE